MPLAPVLTGALSFPVANILDGLRSLAANRMERWADKDKMAKKFGTRNTENVQEHPTQGPSAAVSTAPPHTTGEPGATPEGFIGKIEVAQRLNKTLRTVDNWMQRGILPYYKIGRSVVFKWSDVEAHLAQTCRVCRGSRP